jgi:plastocyanin
MLVRIRRTAALAAVAAAAALLVAGCSSSSSDSSSSGSTTTAAGSSSAGANAISIKNFAFNPAELRVKVGDKITVSNDDSTTHTMSADDTSTGVDTGNISPGSSKTVTFTKPGTFVYHCHIHSSMTGTVTVA